MKKLFVLLLLLSTACAAPPPTCPDDGGDDVVAEVYELQQSMREPYVSCDVDDDCRAVSVDVGCGEGRLQLSTCQEAVHVDHVDAFNNDWTAVTNENCSTWPACAMAADCAPAMVGCVDGACVMAEVEACSIEAFADVDRQLYGGMAEVLVDKTDCAVDDDCRLYTYWDVGCAAGGPRTSLCNVVYAIDQEDAVQTEWQMFLDDNCADWPTCVGGPECEENVARCVGGSCQAVAE